VSFQPEPIRSDTWPGIYAILAPAMKVSGESAAELIDQLIDGTAQLWVLRKGGDPIAAAVSELVPSPLGLVVHGRLCAGKGMSGWLEDLIACITRHAKEAGAVGIEIEGRAGWERLLKARGWHRKAVVMAVRLVPERVA
jgi:hypothetical protein